MGIRVRECMCERQLRVCMHVQADCTPPAGLSPALGVQDERAEHLRGFSFLSGIVAGFIVASFLQVTFQPLETSRGYQLAFAVTVGLTVRMAPCTDCMLLLR